MLIPVDNDYNAAHNELYRDSRRLQLSAAVMGALLILIGLVLRPWQQDAALVRILIAALLVLGGLVCLVLIPVLRRSIGTPEHTYNSYPLVPAIVAKKGPRDGVLLALVNTTIDPEGQPQWALATRTITKLNGDTPTLGARVPSVAVSGRSGGSRTHYGEISPMPVTWATPDKSVVKQATKAIAHSEWTRLEGLRDRVDDVLATRNNLLPL